VAERDGWTIIRALLMGYVRSGGPLPGDAAQRQQAAAVYPGVGPVGIDAEQVEI